MLKLQFHLTNHISLKIIVYHYTIMNQIYLLFLFYRDIVRTPVYAKNKKLDFINSTSILQYNMYQLMLKRNYTTDE